MYFYLWCLLQPEVSLQDHDYEMIILMLFDFFHLRYTYIQFWSEFVTVLSLEILEIKKKKLPSLVFYIHAVDCFQCAARMSFNYLWSVI